MSDLLKWISLMNLLREVVGDYISEYDGANLKQEEKLK